MADISPPAHFRRNARPSRHQARRAETVLRLAQGLTGRALDYGCGWGDLTFRLAPQFEQIEGVDVSAERVAFAAREFAPIPFRQCSESGIEMGDASIDVVVSTVVLHFVPSPEGYLAECRRLLRSGGALVVMIQNPEALWNMASRWRRGAPEHHEWTASAIKTWSGTLTSFRDWLEQQDFAIERTEGFYDPPFDRLRAPGELVVSAMNAVGHLCAIKGHWSYVGFRCRRVG